MNASKPSFLEMIFPFVVVLGIFYFLVIRPQSQRMKKQQKMWESLKPGDQVVTQSGIIATIHQVQDQIVILELGSHVRVPVLKRFILGLKDEVLKSDDSRA